MKFDDYRKYDAIGLAALIVKRQVSAKEVLETAIARAEQVNPSINAIIHTQYERARRAVTHGLPQGPLTGVPFLIKDLGFFEPGEPATRVTGPLQRHEDGGDPSFMQQTAPQIRRPVGGHH